MPEQAMSAECSRGAATCGVRTRTLDEEGRATDGKPIKPGDTFRTLSGRATTPYPSSKKQWAADAWLVENAVAEAKSRGDSFNEKVFGSEQPAAKRPLPPASIASMLLYLFAWQPPRTGSEAGVSVQAKQGEGVGSAS